MTDRPAPEGGREERGEAAPPSPSRPALWLGDRRGAAVDWTTQQWVKATGRRVDVAETPWLDGPTGEPSGIGEEFFEAWAAANGLSVEEDLGAEAGGAARGLLPSLDALSGPGFDAGAVDASVRDFYGRTSAYEVEAWAEWSGLFRPFGGLVATLFSRRLDQLNLPLGALDTSRGTTSRVLHLVRPGGGVAMAAWVRTLRATGRSLYVGAYSAARVPGHPAPCVRVVFPLPNGACTVLLRPEVDEGGALRLVSSGAAWGDPGLYLNVHDGGRVWGRAVRSLRETIRVYAARDGVRTDHTLRLGGRVFLRLHYRLTAPPAA
ncbi:hypothetical protein RQM47_13060 [Rubrivirga sp. S365]|uniref:hypothetical protein n=1 Tax=Rubrivirga sp. S365 TaxID=3076080 RepID=UPI0028CA3039|nr:hypothetical protein [Rubrivirga sp. S365]MDT7857575.1 hypothetical protein [Rubrivirga sp. S365]